MSELTAVKILGQSLPIARPDRATIEELMQQLFELQRAWEAADAEERSGGLVARSHRLNAAFLGLSTQLGDRAKASWSKSGCDAMVYGGKVLSYLLEQGASRTELAEAAKPLVVWLSGFMFPRAKEVEEKTGFSRAGEGA